MMRKSLLHNLRFSPVKHIEIISNPVNIENIEKMRTAPFTDKMPFDINIVGCGRLIEIKGFDSLIKSFGLVAEKYKYAGLVLIGDGPCRGALEKLADDLGLADRVFFAGRQNNPINWFAHADIGVISSVKEGFPNVLLEMLASGTKYIISTPCTDGLESIPDINLLADCSPRAIANGLDAALITRADMAENYIQYIASCRSVPAFWQKVEDSLSS